jgi:tetratricopeptide (TPR) repeat protein
MPGAFSPEQIAGFILALEKSFAYEKATEMKLWSQAQYPNHFTVILSLAEECLKKQQWPEAMVLLETISRESLPPGSVGHYYHLLGMGRFVAGKVEEALKLWLKGLNGGKQKDHQECNLTSYIDYASLCLMPPNERRAQNATLAAALEMFESVDRFFAHDQWEQGIEALEKEGNSEADDCQFLARLAWGYLHVKVPQSEPKWLRKVMALGHFWEKYENGNYQGDLVFPPFIETWPESRKSEVAHQAKAWLDQLPDKDPTGYQD